MYNVVSSIRVNKACDPNLLAVELLNFIRFDNLRCSGLLPLVSDSKPQSSHRHLINCCYFVPQMSPKLTKRLVTLKIKHTSQTLQICSIYGVTYLRFRFYFVLNN